LHGGPQSAALDRDPSSVVPLAYASDSGAPRLLPVRAAAAHRSVPTKLKTALTGAHILPRPQSDSVRPAAANPK